MTQEPLKTPKHRLRFSLLNLLLMTAIVALALGLWREHEKLRPLEERVLKLRREAGIVDAKDPNKLYLRKLKDRTGSQPFLWRAYVPPGEWAYARLKVRDLNKPNSRGSIGSIGLAPGESSFAFSNSKKSYKLTRVTQFGGSQAGVGSKGTSSELQLASKEELSDLAKGINVGETITLLKGISEVESGEQIEVTIFIELFDRQTAKAK